VRGVWVWILFSGVWGGCATAPLPPQAVPALWPGDGKNDEKHGWQALERHTEQDQALILKALLKAYPQAVEPKLMWAWFTLKQGRGRESTLLLKHIKRTWLKSPSNPPTWLPLWTRLYQAAYPQTLSGRGNRHVAP
jgi:hypothetical protein